MNTALTIDAHRISQATWVPSPHFDARPSGEVSLIVVHGISLPPGLWNPWPVLSFFQGRLNHTVDPYFKALIGVRVSSHLVIGRLGELYQTVAFDQRAWHAGESSYKERSACNDFSIGIELIGAEEGPFTDAQIESLADVCRAVCVTYGVDPQAIVGHRDVAPGRKVDPGADFPFDRIRLPG